MERNYNAPPENTPKQEPKQPKTNWTSFPKRISDYFFETFDLKEGLDREGTIIAIRNNKRMVGANVWLLVCAIMIASIGLDTNSAAVIIGAMLISPLMSPILGIGLAIGINDRQMLIISLKHFLTAVIISLITSAVYFLSTPLGEATNEMLSRTTPTLLDVLVAIFGGIAGIVSGSRKDKTNAIPGVAIATALLPPLCVAGYGLAHAEWTIFMNSFYLFFLNSVFVALSTYVIVRWLKFPLKTHVSSKENKKASLYITIFSLFVIAPSLFILSQVLQEQQQRRNAASFVETHFKGKHEAIKWERNKIAETDSMELKIYLSGDPVSQDSINMYGRIMKKEDIAHTTLKIIQVNVPKQDYSKLEKSVQDKMLKLLEAEKTIKEANKNQLSEKDKTIQDLNHCIDSLIASDTIPMQAFGQKLNILFPEVTKLGFAKAQETDFKKTGKDIPIVLLKWSPKVPRSIRRKKQVQLRQFVQLELALDTLQVVSY